LTNYSRTAISLEPLKHFRISDFTFEKIKSRKKRRRKNAFPEKETLALELDFLKPQLKVNPSH